MRVKCWCEMCVTFAVTVSEMYDSFQEGSLHSVRTQIFMASTTVCGGELAIATIFWWDT